jgi:ketosteroid isomerase-like protein
VAMSDPTSTNADRTALRQQVMESESALYRAQIAGSIDEIEPFLSADLVYVHSTGVAESKEEYLAGVADGRYEYGMIESREDTRLQVFADVAIMNGIVDMTVSAHGATKQFIHLLFCLVWVRQGDAWQLDFRQATRIPSGKD